MDQSIALLWSQMNVLNWRRVQMLCAEYGDLQEAAVQLSPGMLARLGCARETVEEAMQRRERFDRKRTEDELAARRIRFFTWEDPAYPDMLRHTADPPPFLYVRGEIGCLHPHSLAIVGTRKMTPYGAAVVAAIVPPLVRAGITTVSGLARGVDAAVARETLRAGGKTVAVLGHGLASVYPPEHASLAGDIVAAGGMIVSEYPMDAPAASHTFPGRNRIIAGLGCGTLVIEAPRESGALLTAAFALDEGREVFAIPSSVFAERSAGCHHLIARGHARLVTGPGDILAELGYESPATEVATNFALPVDASRVLAALNAEPSELDALVASTGMSASAIAAALTTLELSGNARNLGGGQWIRMNGVL